MGWLNQRNWYVFLHPNCNLKSGIAVSYFISFHLLCRLAVINITWTTFFMNKVNTYFTLILVWDCKFLNESSMSIQTVFTLVLCKGVSDAQLRFSRIKIRLNCRTRVTGILSVWYTLCFVAQLIIFKIIFVYTIVYYEMQPVRTD